MDTDKQGNLTSRLEQAIVAAKEGRSSIEELVAVLLSETVFVPSGTEPKERFDELTPVLYMKEKTEMVVVFSSLKKAESIREQAGFLLQVQFAALIKALKPESGIVVNPGWDDMFEIAPYGIDEMRKRLVAADNPVGPVPAKNPSTPPAPP